jgi:lysozyme
MANMTLKGKVGGSAAVLGIAMMIATPALMKSEGLVLGPYYDSVNKLSWCYGETEGTPKARYTKAECDAMLGVALETRYAQPVVKCTPNIENPYILASAIKFSYNGGVNAYCGSSMARHFNAGRYREGCEAYMAWNRGTFAKPFKGGDCKPKKSGGYLCVIKGLTNTRMVDRDMCLKGLL